MRRTPGFVLLPLLALALSCVAVPTAPALERDGWRVGIQVGGTGLVSVLAFLRDLSSALVMVVAATGVDWNVWSTLSLCGEGNLLVAVWPWPPRLTVMMPALSLRAGL